MTRRDDECRRSVRLPYVVGAGAALAPTLGGVLAVPPILEARKNDNEIAAIEALKAIRKAEALFRHSDAEGDGWLDYGTLQELAKTGMIDAVLGPGTGKGYLFEELDRASVINAELGSGTYKGYVFECSYSASTSEFLWFATARPIEPGVTGDRYFATNYEGVTFASPSKPFRLNTVDCLMPAPFRRARSPR